MTNNQSVGTNTNIIYTWGRYRGDLHVWGPIIMVRDVSKVKDRFLIKMKSEKCSLTH